MILADDEPIISRGIQRLMDWAALGIEITGIYEDGKSAFSAIVCDKPDLALLDISMPGMSGIDILKECSAMRLKTKIIFISGFQDFEYAKSAITYGAVDYLLKPVIREELMNALEKCLSDEKRSRGKQDADPQSSGAWQGEADYGRLIQLEDASYIPVYTQIVYDGQKNDREKRLMQFSLSGFLEEYLEEHKNGITVSKNDHVVLILKQEDDADVEGKSLVADILEEIRQHFMQMTGLQLFFIVGPRVEHMSEIPGAYEACLEKRGYAYFANEIASGMVDTQREVFGTRIEIERFERARADLISAMTGQDKDACEHYYDQVSRLICRMAEGKKEDACFHFCSLIRRADERMHALGLKAQECDTRELLERARQSINFTQLSAMFHDLLLENLYTVQKVASNSEMQNLIKAKEYIETHYSENLTLQVLAEHIHMNPSYFSLFFKKNSGENFKDYVSRVRLDHAMPLLISSNKKTYEIAIEVGFTDARNFTDAFQRVYKETPNSFRKRIRSENGEL